MNDKERIFDQLRRIRERQDDLEHERQKAEIWAKSHALVWRGPVEELTYTIINWFEAGSLESESRSEAVRKASVHFVKPDGSTAFLPMREGDEVQEPRKLFDSPLPGATIVGAHIDDWVAWNGESYVLRQTRESVLADKGLKLIGSVKELSQSPRRFGPGIITVVVTEPSAEDTVTTESQKQEPARAEIDRRERLLADYKTATENPSNKRIYEAKNSGLYKPQFYEWLRGTLSSESATTVAFERFLKAKKPPIPRKPKT